MYFLYVDISYQRFYSISSSPQAHPGEIHATVAVVRFKKESKFLQRLLFV
jgi:sulfite reductase alpha subunit-like flavoprotein